MKIISSLYDPKIAQNKTKQNICLCKKYEPHKIKSKISQLTSHAADKDDGDHMHGMFPPTGGGASNENMTMMNPGHMLMHMTFFWGKNTEILFAGWPGYDRLGMYILALVVVFLLALFVEWLSHCSILRETSGHGGAAAGMVQTAVHALRVGLAYLVMLAVMSFNAGVFLVAVSGHTLGFFLFGSTAFRKPPPENGAK